ncbi:MAG: mevalonate kinase family protein [Kiritimatiellia bacterium]
MIIRKKAYPRAGLVGNPSDGYYGKTISLTFGNFCAEVVLYESPDLHILPSTRDMSRFQSIGHLAEDVRLYGYYGGIRLLKATIKRFYDYCTDRGIELHGRNFTIEYYSNIPHMVGLAGSSAIITACLRALMAFYGVTIPKPEQANLILSVELNELGISAGLQDRVAQVYQGLVYMDFNRAIMEKQGYGHYEELDPSLLPPLYIAYRTDLAQGSEIFHNNIRERFLRGDPEILDAIRFWIELTDQVRQALLAGKGNTIGPLLNANFDRRAKIYRIGSGNLRMVEAARSTGASAKFTGSGGAIIGTYEDDKMFQVLKTVLEPMNIQVIRPVIVAGSE